MKPQKITDEDLQIILSNIGVCLQLYSQKIRWGDVKIQIAHKDVLKDLFWHLGEVFHDVVRTTWKK